MDNRTLHTKYFKEGTSGFAIICRFFQKYNDVLVRVQCTDINDLVNEVFLSLSRTDFQQVQNEQHYIMRAIKLHCWSLLDKAIRRKARVTEAPRFGDQENAETRNDLETVSQDQHDHLTEIEGMELLANVNLFKAHVSQRDAQLLNLLIDEAPRSDMAELLGLNMNTLDTQIRRLRIKLVDYLKSLGYTYNALERFN